MKKIAIVRYATIWDDDLERYVAHHMTNFTEVNDSDYKLLKEGLAYLNRINKYEDSYAMVEQVENTTTFIASTIKEYLEQVKKELEIVAERKKAKEEKKKERELKKLAKNKEEEKALYEQLKSKFEVN